MDENDPLASLVVDAAEVDRKRIAEVLSGVVYIDRSGRVIPVDGFGGLNQAEQVLAALLGRKVAVLLELTESEAAGVTDLASETGIVTGSMGTVLRRLYADRLVSQDVDKCYYLSPHQVGTAIDRLSGSPADDVGGDNKSLGAPAKRARRTDAKKNSKRRASQAKNPVTASDDSGVNAPRKAKSGFSPTTAVRHMIDEGFFTSPKTLSDVQGRLKDKQGRDVPTSTLSPIFTRLLRDGALDRGKNDEGAYEYTATS